MMIQLYQPLNFMGLVYREVKQAIIDIDMMSAILGQAPEVEDQPGRRGAGRHGRGHLRFEDVWFRYDAEARDPQAACQLRGAPRQDRGRGGALGRRQVDAVAALMFRFYEPYRGRITIDGQDIAAVTQASLREAIGMVPQDTVLFNDTLGYNIRYGRWGADGLPRSQEAARSPRSTASSPPCRTATGPRWASAG